MAPTPHETDLTTKLFSSTAPNLLTTMSSPNLHAASILRNQSTRTSTQSLSSDSSNLSEMKTVYVGKDQHPVTIMQMPHVNEAVWKKAASFENLCNTVHSLHEAHSTADIMALITTEIPMDTGTAFQEAQAASKVVMNHVYNIGNLNPSAFLNSVGKTLKVAPTARPEDLTFFRFQCDLDGREIDNRIMMAGDISFQFCLRLPQHLLNVANNTVEDISVTPKKKEGKGSTMSEFMQELSAYGSPVKKALFPGRDDSSNDEEEVEIIDKDTGERDFGKEVERDDANTAARNKAAAQASALDMISPKFKGMFGKDDKEYKKGYYGPFSFFNSQHEFHQVFGNKPIILKSNPMGGSNKVIKDKLREYGEKCKLDIYLNLYELT